MALCSRTAPSCAWPARRSRSSRSRPQAHTSSRASPGTSATATPRCRCWATRCASGATPCWKTCCAASARGSPRSRRHSTRSTVLMDTRATTTMGTKRSRRRTARGTRARRVVRDAALPPLVPAKAEPQFTNVDKAVLDSRLRGNERSKRGAGKDAGTAAGNLNAAALYRLMAWLSPAYPIGAFSYSSGIEWAVEAGDVTDAATLERWLAVMIADGGGFCDAVFFVHAHRAAAERNDEALRAVAELAAVFAPSQERHLETTAQGHAFLDATRAAWPTPALDRLLAVWDGAVALPVAVAVAGAGHEIALAPALQAYLHALTANLISAGVRLVPLGQTDGQRVLAALEPVVAATAARALATTLDDVGGAAFRADLASMRHETQHTRLFRS